MKIIIITLNNGDEYTLFVSFYDKNDDETEKVGLIQIELRAFSSEKKIGRAHV